MARRRGGFFVARAYCAAVALTQLSNLTPCAKRNVFEAALYVLSNARRDRIRILSWERNSLVMWSKRLEQQRFISPRMSAGDTVSMSGARLNQLLDGYDVWAERHRELQLKRVG